MDSSSAAGQALSFAQVDKLYGVLFDPIEIQSSNNFPSLSISPANLVQVVRERLLKKSIHINDIRLNGSAASYCICDDPSALPQIHYNDVDLIFGVSIEREDDFRVIKEEVLTSFLEFLPEEVSKEHISPDMLGETYIRKMILVNNYHNKWSLFSLGDDVKGIELKFVSVLRRKFQFTLDSFQIVLDSLLSFGQCAEKSPNVSVSRAFFPSVQALSVYHNFSEALYHLNHRLIHTEAPEGIRGGGLLKYCSLLVHGFNAADPETMEKLEPYMCSRFFIDFPTSDMQFQTIFKFISIKFIHCKEFTKSMQFLDNLYNIVNTCAMCLMESERQKTIAIIMQIRFHLSQWCPPLFHQPFRPPMTSLSNHHYPLPVVMRGGHHQQQQHRSSPPPPPPAQFIKNQALGGNFRPIPSTRVR